jgi:single-strand DNA-binding protein
MNLNKVMIAGNLTRDPELRYTPKGQAVADIGIAVNRVWYADDQKQEETTFIDATIWGRQAENVSQYLSKGRGVFIEGRIQVETWEDKNSGQKRSKFKVVAESVQFVGSGKSDRPAPQTQQTPQTQPAAQDPDDCDDIPF